MRVKTVKTSHYVSDFPISKISESEEFQARTEYDEDSITNLSKKIEAGTQLDPIHLWHRGEDYLKLAGFCRTRAIKKLGHSTIKVFVYEELTEREAWEVSIETNEDRVDLAPDEKVSNIVTLREKGIEAEWIMDKYNLNRTGFYNLLSLKDMDSVSKYCLHRGLIQVNHAVELMRVKEESQRWNYLKTIMSFRLSVRDTELLIKGLLQWEWKRRRQLCPKKIAEKAEEFGCDIAIGLDGVPKVLTCLTCSYYGGLSEPVKEEQVEQKKVLSKDGISIGLIKEYANLSKFKVQCSYSLPKELEPIVKFGYTFKEVTKQVDVREDGTVIEDKEQMSAEKIKWIEEHPFTEDSKDTMNSYWNSFKGEEREIVKAYYIEIERYSGLKREYFKLDFKAKYPKIYAKFSHYNVAVNDFKDRQHSRYHSDLTKLKKRPEVQAYLEAERWIKENTASAKVEKNKQVNKHK